MTHRSGLQKPHFVLVNDTRTSDVPRSVCTACAKESASGRLKSGSLMILPFIHSVNFPADDSRTHVVS